jgi:hypothetical protein
MTARARAIIAMDIGAGAQAWVPQAICIAMAQRNAFLSHCNIKLSRAAAFILRSYSTAIISPLNSARAKAYDCGIFVSPKQEFWYGT